LLPETPELVGSSEDKVGATFHDLGRILRHSLRMGRKCAELDGEVFSFDKTGPLQSIKKAATASGRWSSCAMRPSNHPQSHAFGSKGQSSSRGMQPQAAALSVYLSRLIFSMSGFAARIICTAPLREAKRN
jgi:hypothetical protein